MIDPFICQSTERSYSTGSLTNAHVRNSVHKYNLQIVPQPGRFSYTLLFFLTAFDIFSLFKIIVLPCYTVSTSFQSTGYVKKNLFLCVGD
jgi:hypothetical protein